MQVRSDKNELKHSSQIGKLSNWNSNIISNYVYFVQVRSDKNELKQLLQIGKMRQARLRQFMIEHTRSLQKFHSVHAAFERW